MPKALARLQKPKLVTWEARRDMVIVSDTLDGRETFNNMAKLLGYIP